MHLCAEMTLCTVLLALSLSIRSSLAEAEGAWYRGCFMQTGDIFKNDQEIPANLTACSIECMNNRYYFIALQGDRCRCLSRVDDLFPAAEDMCDNRCTGLQEPNLPCGGQTVNTWSVYAASGPFIVKVEPQETFQWIEPNIPTTLEAVVEFKEFVDITEEHLIESEWGNTVEFVWQSGLQVVSVNISANSSQELAMCTFTFPNTGQFPIGLKVRNLLSSMQTDFIVTVEVPKPRDIQLRAIIDEWLLPSCIPPINHMKNTRKSRRNHDELVAIENGTTVEENSEVKPLVAVFVNTTFDLQVAVATGSDLVFKINIWNGQSWETFQPVAHQGGVLCDTPLACRTAVQNYSFETTGIFPVSATVSNQFGSVEGSLRVVVMDQHITDVTAMLVTPNSSIVHTETKLLFHLTAITADRRSTQIRADFGDGAMKTARLREKQNMSHTDLEDSDPPDPPTLFASYGEGCNLSLQFDHIYEKEGVFVPHITLFNNMSFVAFDLKKEITVVNEILGLEIKSPKYVPTKKPVDFFINYSSISSNRTVVWTITDDSQNVLANKSTTSLQFVFSFPVAGQYKIVCVVSNLLGSKTVHAHVIVQEPVGRVNLSCVGGPYIEIKYTIVCSAKAEFGGDIHFKWDFQDKQSNDVRSGNLTTIAEHTFFNPGVYNVSIHAHNNVSHVVEQLPYSIHVEIPVECLNVITKPPPLLAEAVSFVAVATRGTNLTFFLDVSPDVKISPHEVEVYGNSTIFYARHKFPGPATHKVRVTAFNHISNVSRWVDVHVQDPPPEFTIHVLPAPLPDFQIVALKDGRGNCLQRSDLLFQFDFSDGTTRVTRAPVVIWEMRLLNRRRSTRDSIDDSGDHGDDVDTVDLLNGWQESQPQVNVTVSNIAGRTSQVLSLANNESSVESDSSSVKNKNRKPMKKAVLWHSTFVKTGEFTSFLLANKSNDFSSVDVDYGDGKTESISCLSDSCSWGRKFHHPGVFAVDVSLTGSRTRHQDQTVGSVLVVEEEVKGLRIVGPIDVGIGCDQEWTAELQAGSHIIYVWSLDGVPGVPTTINKYLAGFSKHGSHTLQLNVSNDISTAQASLKVTVKHPITDVSMDIVPSSSVTSIDITVEIEGGGEFTVGCSFGDGQYATFSPWNLTLVKLRDSPNPALALDNQAAVYRTVLKHDYKTAGEYNVSLTVSNGISSFHRIAKAVVEEGIGDIVLSTENSQILAIDDPLVVTAVVSSGQHLEFVWNFSDNMLLTVHSDGNSSTVSHMFSMANKYEISVTVSNHLQKSRRAVLPFLINVVEPISGLTITCVDNAAKRLHNEAQIVAAILTHADGSNSTEEIHFEARASSGTSVEFMFNFGDGHFQVVNGTDNVYLMILASTKHVYTQEGVYSVSVTASNPLGRQTVFLPNDFIVQFPPHGLTLVASENCVQLGKMISFSATVQSGTNVTFTWKFMDQTELVDRSGSYVEHQYLQYGEKHIQVTAKNKVNATVAYYNVTIAEKILGVNFSVSGSLVEAWKPVQHVVTLHPPSVESAEPAVVYNWLFGFNHSDLPLQSKNKTLTYIYKPGRHFVRVEAGNCLGSVKSSVIELHAVGKLKCLSFNFLGTVTVSSPVVFEAVLFLGDHQTYTWNFGDGTQNVTTKHSIISHKYSQIGEYIIRLHAENPLSRQDFTQKIFVLTQPCSPPGITALHMNTSGMQKELMFLYSEPVLVEAAVKVVCNTSAYVKFFWKVLNASRQPVKSLINWSMKNHQKYFHYPALLLPARTLEPGQYAVQLTVEMSATEIPVYSEFEIIITVLATPLVSVIRGGISRYVGQENLVHLDGRGSGYPDNSSANLRFNWTCYALPMAAYDCFQSPDQVPVLNGTQLIFPASWLNSNFTQFRFNLTVLRIDDQGMTVESATSDQVIEREPTRRTLDLLLECSQCWHNTVNFHRKISIRLHCPTCSRGPLTYTWKVQTLTIENTNREFIGKGLFVCSKTVGTEAHFMTYIDDSKTKKSHFINATNQMSNTTSSATTVIIDGVQVVRSQTQPELIMDTMTAERQESRANQRLDGVPGGLTESKGDSLSSHMLPDPSRNTNITLKGYVIDIATGELPDPKEHHWGGRIIPVGPTQAEPIALTEDPCGSMCIRHITPAPPPPDHLINKMRDFLTLTHDQTLTGLDQPSLVIKPGVLQPGRTYFVEVIAADADGTSGAATFYFEVNNIPWKGKCTMRPFKGIALTTVFTIFCSDWVDENNNLPLRYKVGYSLDKSEVDKNLNIVYYGMKHDISFQLPAGLAPNGYEVLVQVAVINRLGGQTLTCFAAVEVLPHAAFGRQTTTDFFLLESERLYQHARDSVYEGARDDVYGPLTLVASSLNALNNLGHVETAAAIDSALAREKIMDSLTYLTLRDEVEVIQALQSLVDITSGPDQACLPACLLTFSIGLCSFGL